MAKRTDVHSPSNIIPENYEFVCVRTREEFDGGFLNLQQQLFIKHRQLTGGQFSTHEHGGNCHVCGAYMIDYAIFYHEPTNSYIRTGLDCADKIDGGHADAFRRARTERKALEFARAGKLKAQGTLRERGLLEKIENQFVDRNISGNVLPLDNEDRNYDKRLIARISNAQSIIADLVGKLIKYGDLSVKQWAFLEKLLDQVDLKAINEQQDKIDVENANKVPAPTGKVEVAGKILTIKGQEGYFGYEVKCLVEDDRGFKVWGTHSKKMDELGLGIGDRVSFVATLEVKGDDESFAIFKRPSKVKKA